MFGNKYLSEDEYKSQYNGVVNINKIIHVDLDWYKSVQTDEDGNTIAVPKQLRIFVHYDSKNRNFILEYKNKELKEQVIIPLQEKNQKYLIKGSAVVSMLKHILRLKLSKILQGIKPTISIHINNPDSEEDKAIEICMTQHVKWPDIDEL